MNGWSVPLCLECCTLRIVWCGYCAVLAGCKGSECGLAMYKQLVHAIVRVFFRNREFRFSTIHFRSVTIIRLSPTTPYGKIIPLPKP